jgi:peptide/nickel transport system permease protein
MIFVVALNFTIVHIAPGGPEAMLFGPRIGEDVRERYRRNLGLDRPLYEQFITYLKELFSGNLGISYQYDRTVTHVIGGRVWPTTLLIGTALILSTVIAIPLGVMSATKQYSKTDHAITFGGLAGISFPIFWLGLLFQLMFAVYLDWTPVSGYETTGSAATGFAHYKDIFMHLLLPMLTLTVANLAVVMRLTRSSMLEVLRQDFVLTARAKGLSERSVIYSHALRNALRPVITILALSIGFLLTGAVLTETVFNWPGLGRLAFESIFTRDYPVLLGLFFVVAIMVILANLGADVVYALIDPRVKY